jgi:hypothetical protein
MQFSYGRVIFNDNYTVGGNFSNSDVFTTEVFKQNRTDAKFPKGRTIFSRSWLAWPVTVSAPGFNSGLRYKNNRQDTWERGLPRNVDIQLPDVTVSWPFSFFLTSQVEGRRWSLQLKDRGRDKVLPDQGCRTPQGAVTDECAAMVACWLAGKTG